MQIKVKGQIILCAVWIFLLCSCAQGQADSDRLLAGESGEDAVAADTSTSDEGSASSDEAGEVTGSVFAVEDFFGYGAVNFTVDQAFLADSLEAAGIDEDAYQLSGSEPCENYLVVSMTIENVSVPMEDEATAEAVSNFTLINEFSLYVQTGQSEAEQIIHEPVYFDRGGEANTDAKRYFEYRLPDQGETMEAVIAFGISDQELSSIQENDTPIYLVDTVTSDRMEMNDIL